MEPEVVNAIVEYVVVEGGLGHKRYLVEGRTVDDGRCGADNNWRRVALIPDDVERCGFCWPTERA